MAVVCNRSDALLTYTAASSLQRLSPTFLGKVFGVSTRFVHEIVARFREEAASELDSSSSASLGGARAGEESQPPRGGGSGSGGSSRKGGGKQRKRGGSRKQAGSDVSERAN